MPKQKFNRNDFKYISKFNTKANIGSKEAFASNEMIASYDLDDLKKLLPDSEEVESNPDLLYTVYNAAAINLINENGDGLRTEEAISVAKTFKNKQCNVEHMRDMIIGHSFNYGFSTFPDNKIVDVSALSGSVDPFNISIAAVLYRVASSYYVEIIEESSDPKSYYYKNISASWEIGFNEYDLCLGSKRVKDAEIVTDEKQVEELSEYLAVKGGSGFMDDGTPVYRLPKGDDLRALGTGFTTSPASAVKGIAIASKDGEFEEMVRKVIINFNSEKALDVKLESEEEAAASQKDKKNIEKSSQNKNTTVNKNKIMKIKDINDIQQDQWEEIQASNVREFFNEKLEEANEKFAAEEAKRIQLEAEATEATEKVEATATELASVKVELEKVQNEFTALKEKAEAAEKASKFNERMAKITEKFELSERESEIVAKSIRELDDDAFASWSDDFEVLSASKIKGDNEGKTEDKPGEESNASVDDLKTVGKSKEGIVSGASGGSEEEDELEALAKSFSIQDGGVEIK